MLQFLLMKGTSTISRGHLQPYLPRDSSTHVPPLKQLVHIQGADKQLSCYNDNDNDIEIMIRNLFSERKISDFIGHVTPSVYTLFPVPLSGNPLTNGQHGDKYLSQRKSSKQPLFPYQMTSEDSANSAPPPFPYTSTV